MFHGYLKKILKLLKRYMTKWDVIRCADNHFCRVIYGIGPYIANYPKQVLIAGIVNGWCPAYSSPHPVSAIHSQDHRCDAPTTDLDCPGAEPQTLEKMEVLFETKSNNELWFNHGLISNLCVCLGCPTRSKALLKPLQPFTSNFPHANIHKLLTPDLLHQAIKGTFKDHLISWVQDYLKKQHRPTEAKCVLNEIDQRLALTLKLVSSLSNLTTHRISLAPPFPGLHQFKQGRNFQQWTGDDSKALMKVSGHHDFSPQLKMLTQHRYTSLLLKELFLSISQKLSMCSSTFVISHRSLH